MLDAGRERFGTMHGLVNNAAGNFICPTERLSYNAFNSVVDIVLKGTYNCTLALGKRWIAAGTPGVGAEHQHDLRLDRLGLRRAFGRVESRRIDYGAFAGLGVGQVRHSLERHRAGHISTEGAWSRLRAPSLARQADRPKRIPLGRHGEHQELSNLAAYLLSDFSAYITGACVTIDGGRWLRGAGKFNAGRSYRSSGMNCRPPSSRAGSNRPVSLFPHR